MNNLREYLEKGADELGLVLEQTHLEKLSIFADELCKWNQKINLTSITRIEDIAVKHFLDSLVILKYVHIGKVLLDIGSGGGFPSIPLKILMPSAEFVSVDAVEKKIHFQRHIARKLSLNKFEAVHARVEDLVRVYPERFDRIVSRAFADIAKFIQLALPLLAPNGIIIAMKGRDGRKETEESADKLIELGVTVSDIYEFRLPLSLEQRSLVIFKRNND